MRGVTPTLLTMLKLRQRPCKVAAGAMMEAEDLCCAAMCNNFILFYLSELCLVSLIVGQGNLMKAQCIAALIKLLL